MNLIGKQTQQLTRNIITNTSKNYFCTSKTPQQEQEQKYSPSESHTHETKDDFYTSYRKDVFQAFYKTTNPNEENHFQRIPGYATPEGTLKYSKRRDGFVVSEHFRKPFRDDLTISSIGIGTYTGTPDSTDDLKMFNAITDSVISGGVNMIDTALNYRYMKSERAVGTALRHLINNLCYDRNELFVCSKGGYVIDDADNGVSGKMQIELLKDIPREEFVTDIHCMHPGYLEYSLQKSLQNLGLETIDLYYLHNSAEQQMSLIGEEKYYDKLKRSFEFLEQQIQANNIRSYGLASWLCFRSPKEEEKIHVSLKKISDIAREIGGENHGLKYIQVPVNVMMPEAFAEKWQESNTKENDEDHEEQVFLLRAARQNKINIITSSPLMQGALMQVPLPTDVFKCKSVAAKHLQFVRSIPSPAILSTLVGQKTNRHTKMNLEIIQHAPLTVDEFWDFMTPKERKQFPEEAIEFD